MTIKFQPTDNGGYAIETEQPLTINKLVGGSALKNSSHFDAATSKQVVALPLTFFYVTEGEGVDSIATIKLPLWKLLDSQLDFDTKERVIHPLQAALAIYIAQKAGTLDQKPWIAALTLEQLAVIQKELRAEKNRIVSKGSSVASFQKLWNWLTQTKRLPLYETFITEIDKAVDIVTKKVTASTPVVSPTVTSSSSSSSSSTFTVARAQPKLLKDLLIAGSINAGQATITFGPQTTTFQDSADIQNYLKLVGTQSTQADEGTVYGFLNSASSSKPSVAAVEKLVTFAGALSKVSPASPLVSHRDPLLALVQQRIKQLLNEDPYLPYDLKKIQAVVQPLDAALFSSLQKLNAYYEQIKADGCEFQVQDKTLKADDLLSFVWGQGQAENIFYPEGFDKKRVRNFRLELTAPANDPQGYYKALAIWSFHNCDSTNDAIKKQVANVTRYLVNVQFYSEHGMALLSENTAYSQRLQQCFTLAMPEKSSRSVSVEMALFTTNGFIRNLLSTVSRLGGENKDSSFHALYKEINKVKDKSEKVCSVESEMNGVSSQISANEKIAATTTAAEVFLKYENVKVEDYQSSFLDDHRNNILNAARLPAVPELDYQVWKNGKGFFGRKFTGAADHMVAFLEGKGHFDKQHYLSWRKKNVWFRAFRPEVEIVNLYISSEEYKNALKLSVTFCDEYAVLHNDYQKLLATLSLTQVDENTYTAWKKGKGWFARNLSSAVNHMREFLGDKINFSAYLTWRDLQGFTAFTSEVDLMNKYLVSPDYQTSKLTTITTKVTEWVNKLVPADLGVDDFLAKAENLYNSLQMLERLGSVGNTAIIQLARNALYDQLVVQFLHDRLWVAGSAKGFKHLDKQDTSIEIINFLIHAGKNWDQTRIIAFKQQVQNKAESMRDGLLLSFAQKIKNAVELRDRTESLSSTYSHKSSSSSSSSSSSHKMPMVNLSYRTANANPIAERLEQNEIDNLLDELADLLPERASDAKEGEATTTLRGYVQERFFELQGNIIAKQKEARAAAAPVATAAMPSSDPFETMHGISKTSLSPRDQNTIKIIARVGTPLQKQQVNGQVKLQLPERRAVISSILSSLNDKIQQFLVDGPHLSTSLAQFNQLRGYVVAQNVDLSGHLNTTRSDFYKALPVIFPTLAKEAQTLFTATGDYIIGRLPRELYQIRYMLYLSAEIDKLIARIDANEELSAVAASYTTLMDKIENAIASLPVEDQTNTRGDDATQSNIYQTNFGTDNYFRSLLKDNYYAAGFCHTPFAAEGILKSKEQLTALLDDPVAMRGAGEILAERRRFASSVYAYQ